MQTILAMMFSIEDASDRFTVFASTLQWTKLDLSFLLFDTQKLFGCVQLSNKMERLGLHCQSTVHNYMLLIIIATILVITVSIIKKYHSRKLIIQKIEHFLYLFLNGNIL